MLFRSLLSDADTVDAAVVERDHGAATLVRCDYLLNEGGGAMIPFDGGRIYGVCVAEKGVHRFELSTSGTAGHASNPRIGDNALLKLAPLLQAMAQRQPGYDPTEAPLRLLAELGLGADPERAMADLRERDPFLALFVDPMLGVTLAPTKVSASDKINVIPSLATIDVDCRTPPGLGEDVVRRRIAEVLGDGAYEVTFTERVIGNSSPVDTPLMEAIRDWIGREDPAGRVVPSMLPAFTDSRTWRDAFPECVAYGFFPMRHTSLYESWPLVHAPDERIAVSDLGFATTFFRDVAVQILG